MVRRPRQQARLFSSCSLTGLPLPCAHCPIAGIRLQGPAYGRHAPPGERALPDGEGDLTGISCLIFGPSAWMGSCTPPPIIGPQAWDRSLSNPLLPPLRHQWGKPRTTLTSLQRCCGDAAPCICAGSSASASHCSAPAPASLFQVRLKGGPDAAARSPGAFQVGNEVHCTALRAVLVLASTLPAQPSPHRRPVPPAPRRPAGGAGAGLSGCGRPGGGH